MPSLICSSRYTVDSQILRKAAQSLGWETLRLDGNKIPDWFDPPDSQIALFYTAPHAFDIAAQLGRMLLGCSPDWTINLPQEFLQRDLRQMTLGEALGIVGTRFVKHAVSKAFPAAVYDAESLAETTATIHPESLVHVGEPVRWKHEFRCFVAHRKVMAVSPYVYNGTIVANYDSFPVITEAGISEVRSFAESVLQRDDVDSPDAFVLDVGQIIGRGWAVVECNECWASGIYACNAEAVLETLVSASVKLDDMRFGRWDFSSHYKAACPGIVR